MWRYKWLAAISLASSVVYLPVVGAPFVADDYLIFFHVSREGVSGIAITPGTLFLRPLTSCMYYLEYRLWTLSPIPSHIVSILAHMLCTLLVGMLTMAIAARGGVTPEVARRSALLAAALFAVLPAHVEAVAWIASRADIMSTIFCLLCLIFLANDFASTNTWLKVAISTSCFAVTLLFKESAVVLPLLVAAWLALGYGRGWRKISPFVGVVIVYLLLRFWLVGKVGGYTTWGNNLLRPWLLAIHGVLYLSYLLQPAPLFGVGRDFWDTLLYLLVGLAMLALARYGLSVSSTSGSRRMALLLLAWTAMCLFPVLPLKPALGHLMNSRYVYLASASTAVLMGTWLAQRWHVRQIRLTLFFLLLIYALGTVRLSQAWYEAGRIARTSLQSLAQVASEQKPVLLLSIPDHYRGAYIWRTSLYEAIRLYIPQAKSPVFVLSRFTMRQDRNVSVQYQGGTVTLSSQEDIFLPPEYPQHLPADLQQVRITSTQISMDPLVIDSYRVLRYERGRFVPVNTASEIQTFAF